MRVLVLMSSYNGERYLREQIDSILQQEGDFELYLHIRDDGSKDDTVAILQAYANANQRVSFEQGENMGYAKSFMTLLQEASGYDYYAFSDQDDTWLPNKIQIALSKLNMVKSPALYASCSYLTDNNHQILGTTQKKVRDITPYNGFIECFMPGHTQVLNHSLLVALKGDYDVARIFAHDFWITTFAINFATVVFDNDAHTYYRQHNENVTGYSSGKFGWYKQRFQRVIKKEANRRAGQIYYFYLYYQKELNQDVRIEMQHFFQTSSLWQRLAYIMKTKLYYQSIKKTILYKVLYI
ncbi:MAG: glycosyltransferase, partial [Erysipelotrichaceae bacterium]